jgi:hypothetical protein
MVNQMFGSADPLLKSKLRPLPDAFAPLSNTLVRAEPQIMNLGFNVVSSTRLPSSYVAEQFNVVEDLTVPGTASSFDVVES